MKLRCLLRGRWAEKRAARYLRRKGLSVIATNLRLGMGEVDILAQEGAVLALIEVRYREKGVQAADLSVTRAKADRLRACWSRLRLRRRLPAGIAVRFDLLLLGGRHQILHLKGVLNQQNASLL